MKNKLPFCSAQLLPNRLLFVTCYEVLITEIYYASVAYHH